MRSHSMTSLGACLLVAAALPASLRAQGATPASPAVAAGYMDRYREILRMAPEAGRSAEVSHLVLTRDVGQLVLEHGRIYPLAPIGGRVVGAVFRGEGRFLFAPPITAEQAELRRFAGATALNDSITEVVMLFADSTAAQLAGLAYGPGDLPSGMADRVRDMVASFKGDHDGAFDPAVIGPLLNGETSGLFVARIERRRGDPVLLIVNPAVAEAVQLYHGVSRRQWGANWAVITQFPPQRPMPFAQNAWRFRERLEVPTYRMDVAINEAVSGNLGLAAGATMGLAAREALGPWLVFALDPRLDIDSVRRGDGTSAPFFKANDEGDAWVDAGHRLQAGDSLSLTIYYHGSLIDRVDNWFFVDPTAAWYPLNGQGRSFSRFDLTYRSPVRYPLASIGDRVDSTVTARVRTTHWITPQPTALASFNLGLFDNFHVEHPDAPPLDVLISEDAHRMMRQQYAQAGIMITEQAHMRENVAADVSNALKLFTHLYGDAPQSRFVVTEIPYGEGVSFPGLIHLSWGTFQNTSLDGFDEFFRAHESAHQWWGNGVRPASYRDAWLSEGLATYCGIAYVQSARHRDTEYMHFLDQYRSDINANLDAGPIWIGYRTSSPTRRRGYDVIIYEKGAWVFHMLRIMLTDLRSMSMDRFNDMMRDFYATYRGRPASTADFQRMVESYTNEPMDWFFDQWVKSTAIPTYHVSWNAQPADNGRYQVRFHVTQENVPPGFRAPVLVAIDLGQNRIARFRLNVTGGQTDYTSPLIPGPPRTVEFNDLHSVLAEVRSERWVAPR